MACHTVLGGEFMRVHIPVVLVALGLFTACDERLSKIAGPSPNLEPTFASIQRDIFEAPDSAGRVACTNCHTSTGRNPSGGLNLNHDVAYEQLINVASRGKPSAVRIVPGNADASYLVQKLEGAPDIVGRRMPFAGAPFLTDGQILILRRWIALGAPRN
jgi:hypothetical protein